MQEQSILHRPRSIRRATAGWALLALGLSLGCASSSGPPLQPLDRKIDLERFMGDWHVTGFIPITVPFFSEEGAHNAVESYRLTEDGIIETTYTFRKDAFDGPRKRYTPKGWVHDERTNTEWRMQFVWPFAAAYLIVHVDPDYEEAIIGVPDRSNVWILTRRWDVSDADYRRLVDRAAALGHDPARIQRVPQYWPAGSTGSR